MKRINWKWLLCLFLLISVSVFAEDIGADATFTGANLDSPTTGEPSIIVKVSVLAGLTLLPYAVILLTSFLKVVIVLALVRNAIGVQQSPPNQAINGIGLLMAIYVMFPTGLAMYDDAKAYLDKAPKAALFSGEAANYIINTADAAKEPFRTFLIKNTAQDHISYFYKLAYKKFPKQYQDKLNIHDFIVITPAYILSQIKSAFEVGVLIYLPFFVVDLVVSNVLLAMGMMMLSPLTIALPLKLLLLVMVDGWSLIVQGLVLSYK